MAEATSSAGVFSREIDKSFIQPAAAPAGAAIVGPTVKGPVEDPTVVTSYAKYEAVFGTTFQHGTNTEEFLTSLAVKNYFEQGGESMLVTRVVGEAYTAASVDILNSGAVSDGFTIETLGKGELLNMTGSANPDGTRPDGTVDNLRWEISNKNQHLGTFTLTVRRGDDSTNSRIVLESFTGISLDPLASNYIEKVIGNQKRTLNVSENYIEVEGDYPNKSNYIRISAIDSKTPNYLANDGVAINDDANGTSYSSSLPVEGNGVFAGATGTVITGALFNEHIVETNTQGLEAGHYTDVLNLLTNKEEYNFKVISAPGLVREFEAHIPEVDRLISLAEGRGDCIAIVDLNIHGVAVSTAAAAGAAVNSSYAATYWPWLSMTSATGNNKWVPASTVIPGVYAFNDNTSAPWFAPAGLVRGGITGVARAERSLTRTQRDTLYIGKINPIASFPGQGISVFGQKTLQAKASALDRVNVRRLLIELKGFIGLQARGLVFEQNTIATRNRFLSKVNPYMELIVQKQGLYTFRVVMDDSNNTADIVDRNQLVGQIFIQPTKTAEFITLDFTIEPTGASFGA